MECTLIFIDSASKQSITVTEQSFTKIMKLKSYIFDSQKNEQLQISKNK